MRVLVACEYSGRVRDAFIARGHDAVSCDLLPTDAEGPHIQGDARDLLQDGWDLLIAHPPCTFLANSGVRHLHTNAKRWPELFDAAALFRAFLNAPVQRIAVENPIMHKYGRELIGGGASGSDNSAVDVRPSRNQGDLPLAQGFAAAQTNQRRKGENGGTTRCGAPSHSSSAAIKGPLETALYHFSGHCRCDGRAVGELTIE